MCNSRKIDPSFFFFFFNSYMDQLTNIHRHFWKERLKINQLAKREFDMPEASEDTALQSRKSLQTFVRREAQSCPPPPPPPIQPSKILRLCGCISSLVFNLSLSNLPTLLFLRRSFQRCRWIFANCSMSRV